MEFSTENNRLYKNDENGKMIAEISFPETAPGVFTIDHTFVDDSLRGQGIADKLVRTAIENIRAKGGHIEATCSYAVRWLEEHPEFER